MFELNIGNIERGWADIDAVLCSQGVLLVFEYTPNDAFTDLLKSAIQLAIYGSSSTILFPNGSQREFISVVKISDDKCMVSIGKCSSEIPIKQYVKSVLRMFDKYIYADSKEGYTEKWRHSFPEKALELLRKLYRTL